MANKMSVTASQHAPDSVVGTTPIIESKLDRSNNYASWKFSMKLTLIGMDLWV